ncbi:hypothetical protein [Pseudomonas vancouverensis]|uniref:Uncharacterized protein n=1 Tax=Pseudomonas vancouverensis TaxID=95300 RepID=A0A1H2N7Y3_PSEVA|nr:hypothetical protein [Pseudomonas vancouverensis]KAB0494004.1 hypothetical protein F7R09_19695 [Pseudomonas vancouverensis]TDB61441.1 hypothetical protein EIY72_15345 [Pseudomonas vancouverensis]SDV01580.1 hypothetical protein SAMN05216558_1850 [Pseudomonas vancouverensis]
MKGITRVIAFAIFLFSVGAIAEPKPAAPAGNGPVAVKVVEPVRMEAGSNELLLLKEQNKLIKEFQSAQQATVYWALSGILGFVVVLMGLSYFTNFKFYEQDKERIKADFESQLKSYRADMNLQLEESKRETDKIVQNNNQIVQDRTILQLSEVRSTVENFRLELAGEIKSVETRVGNLNGSVQIFNKLLANLEAELREVEMEVWELQGIPINMLISLGQALRAAKECDNKPGISRILKKMLGVVENNILKEEETIKEKVLKIVLDDLEFAGTQDPATTAKLKIALAKIPLTEAVSEEA